MTISWPLSEKMAFLSLKTAAWFSDFIKWEQTFRVIIGVAWPNWVWMYLIFFPCAIRRHRYVLGREILSWGNLIRSRPYEMVGVCIRYRALVCLCRSERNISNENQQCGVNYGMRFFFWLSMQISVLLLITGIIFLSNRKSFNTCISLTINEWRRTFKSFRKIDGIMAYLLRINHVD